MQKYAAPDRLLEKRASDLLERPTFAASYADTGRTYPIHTAPAAWVSAAAYHDTRSTDPDVGGRIKAALDWFGISSEWDRLSALRPAEPAAPTVTKWALPDAQRYPLDTGDQVKAAIDYFDRYKTRFSYDERRVFADSLVKCASDHPALFPGRALWQLEAEAGLGLPHPSWRVEFDHRIKRARELGEQELADVLTKTANAVNYGGGGSASFGSSVTMPAGTFRNAAEMSDLLTQLDKRFGWSSGNPMDGLVGETPSTAMAKLATVTKSAHGHWYRITDLDRVPDDLCREIAGLGPIVSRAAKVAMLAKSASFERLVRAQGVDPVEHARRPRVNWETEAA